MQTVIIHDGMIMYEIMCLWNSEGEGEVYSALDTKISPYGPVSLALL